jgi:mono/diheme cytochrome c family protein
MSKKRIAGLAVLLVAAVFVLIQLVPFGRDHSNPPTTQEPNWDNPRTRELAATACFDCHSNETNWPWYSNLAPVSWLIQRDVIVGRSILNFSEWQAHGRNVHEISEVIREGEMPPLQYRLLHASAGLSAAEKRALLDGLDASLVQ